MKTKKTKGGLTREQKIILQEVALDTFLNSNFYFTGGTALASVYLHHRESQDLDFFSEQKFDPLVVLNKVSGWQKKYHFQVSPEVVEDLHIFNIVFPNKSSLKVDFNFYPYPSLEKKQEFLGVGVDSFIDIATNKLLLINQRSEVKDFADLYFLLKKFTVWDLLEGVEKKFKLELDPVNTAADFLKVETFEFLPQMLKPLRLTTLQEFYRNLAKQLAGTALIR